MRKTLLVILLIFSLNLSGLVYAQSPLWNPNYNKVQKLVFDNSASDENLVNFTVLVHLNSSIIDWDDFQIDGDDIRFIDEDYETYLDYEIETWNHGYDAWIWIRVPQIDSSSAIDHIYMYYDNPLAVNGEDKEGTWNDDYVVVQHMVDETNASILDSTQYDNDGVKEGVNEPIETTNGQINSAQDFDGVNDYVDILNDTSLNFENTDNFSIAFWIKYAVSAAGSSIVCKRNTIGFLHGYKIANSAFYICDDLGTSVNMRFTDLRDNTWHYVVCVRDAQSTLRVYIDGIEDANTPDTTTSDLTNDANLFLGTKRNKAGEWVNGTIDSVRISNTTRSADWIEAQYLSMIEDYITHKELSLCESKANIFPLVLVALFVIIGIVVVSRT